MNLSEKLAANRHAKAEKAAARKAKQPQRMVFNKYGADLAISTVLVKHSIAEQDDEAAATLMGICHAAIAGLTGTETSAPWLDDEGFIGLIEFNYFAFALGARLFKFGTDSTREAIAPSQAVFESAAEAMQSIGERKRDKGVYRASGDELKALKEAFAWLESLLSVSSQGHTLTALIDAKKGVQSMTQ